MITQIPTLIHILDSIHYPHTKQLQQELSQGFSLLGNLHPGLNWHVRTGSKYTCPTSIETLRQHNRVYIHKKLQQNHVDPHWQLMATEIATEVKQGRMAGPFQAPGWLQTKTSPLKKYSHTSNLLPLPHPDPIIAMAFSIEQTGSDGKQKIRRGEDWRRSGHNQACHMTDQPYHHTPDHYTWLAQYTRQQSDELPLVWGHDNYHSTILQLLTYYSSHQTALHYGTTTYSFLDPPPVSGHTIDLGTCYRTIACIPVVHYVDDYTDPSNHQAPPHQDLTPSNPSRNNRLPAPTESRESSSSVTPTESQSPLAQPELNTFPNSCNNISARTKLMTPEKARKLAGKCSFTTTQLFGRVGRAALRALYDKAFSNNGTINSHTQSAITALLNILQHCKPRQLPLQPQQTHYTIIYTDAFYKEGDKLLRCSDLYDQEHELTPSPEMTNGWAAVVFHPEAQTPWHSATKTPQTFRQQQSLHILP